MYGNKESDCLKAPTRQYECVVFNVTTGDKSEVSKWISDNAVNVMDVSRLSKDDVDAHLFKLCVEYKAWICFVLFCKFILPVRGVMDQS